MFSVLLFCILLRVSIGVSAATNKPTVPVPLFYNNLKECSLLRAKYYDKIYFELCYFNNLDYLT
ncbi:MAG: hypothetical protein ACJAX4_002416 [Clostridium sp.]|jgi:hypothetical protein